MSGASSGRLYYQKYKAAPWKIVNGKPTRLLTDFELSEWRKRIHSLMTGERPKKPDYRRAIV